MRDLRRYSTRELLAEPAVWAIFAYRFGRGGLGQPFPLRLAASLI
jgi:hypothetical protein